MKVKKFKNFLNEKKTSEYRPPKHLVSPALDPETQEPNDKMYDYIKSKFDNTERYFKPGISASDS